MGSFEATRVEECPGDHYKQIVYRELFEERVATFNILVFPSMNSNGQLLELLGMHKWRRLGEHSVVYEVGMNYKRAARCWLGYDSEDIESAIKILIEGMSSLDRD